jgi:predicted TPR repeat methyltransferase
VVAQAPGVAVYRISLGQVLSRLGRNVEAIDQFHTALKVDPDNGHYRGLVVFALARLGRFEDAAKICEDWQRAEPDNPLPPHHLAALGRGEVPARAADDYVRQVFDNFAGSFEAQLRNLGYRAPDLIADTLAGALGAPAAALDILDAGCGTGLCAPMLRPYAARLAGVDLSPRMLDRARERVLYDQLEEAELTASLNSAQAAWDAIVAADVLCYFGDLAEVSAAAAQALRPGGWLVFSVEQGSPEDTPAGYHLQVHGRYCHSEPYVRQVLADVGLTVESMVSDVLRTEGRQPVQGLVVLARRP